MLNLKSNYKKNVTKSQNFDGKCLRFGFFSKVLTKNMPHWHQNMPVGNPESDAVFFSDYCIFHVYDV